MAYMAREQRKEAIVAAAVSIMLEEGFGAMTTRRVAAELGAANGIIHHHFRTAAELKRAAFGHYLATQRHAFDQALSNVTPAQAVALFVEDQISAAREREMRLWAEAWHEARGDPELAEIYTAAVRDWHSLLCVLLERGTALGVFRQQKDVGALAWRILALGFGLSGMATLPAPPISPAEARKAMADMITCELGISLELRPDCPG